MKPVPFKEQNVTFVSEGCGNLPAHLEGSKITSCWELSEEELDEVVKSKRVFVSVWGDQPPILLEASNPCK